MKFKIWLLLSHLFFWTDARIFTKFIDVKPDQLKPGGEEVRFKFRLGKSRTDMPELMLIASRNWIPIKVRIEGKARRMTVMYQYRGKWGRRGNPQKIIYLNNFNRDNELMIRVNDKEWEIEVNGFPVGKGGKGGDFGPLTHNGSWKKIVRARGKTIKPVRRFSVTQDGRNTEWTRLNHKYCGMNYKLTNSQTQTLASDQPDLFANINIGIDEMQSHCYYKRDGETAVSSRIVGGAPALPGFYPWMVALRLPGTLNVHNCGATLINRCWLVSAAHCFDAHNSEKHYIARIGDYYNKKGNKNGTFDMVESVHESKLKQVIVHNEYNKDAYMNDIALIQLEECVPTIDQFRAPICLPTSTTQHSAEECCHIHGWGQLASDEAQLKKFLLLDKKLSNEDANYRRVFPGYPDKKYHLYPDELQFAINFINSDEQCRKEHPTIYSPGRHLCASFERDNQIAVDTCQGDSGGPFACETPIHTDNDGNEIGQYKSNGQFTLWGITSVGGNAENACSGVGSRSKPGIYTKVVNYMDWIATQFRKNHVDPDA